MQSIPLSESPRRSNRRDGSAPYYGNDARTFESRHNKSNGGTKNAFLESDAPMHVGDGLGHDQSEVVSAPIRTKKEIPVSDQDGSLGPPQPHSGGAFAENHKKSWAGKKGSTGFQHVDPSASKSQRRLMAAAEHGADFPMARKIRKSMTHEQMHDFASTSEKHLPGHVK